MASFQLALTPLVYASYRQASAPSDLARLFRLFIALLLPSCLALILFSPELVAALSTAPYADGWVVVPFLVPAAVVSSLYVFAPGLAIEGRTGRLALIAVAGASVNVSLGVILTPVIGIVGGSLATLVGSCAIFGLAMAASQRAYPVPHHWRSLSLATTLTVLLVVFAAVVGPGLTVVGLLKVAVIAIDVALVALLGLVRESDVREVWTGLVDRQAAA
jgi:O-antigen/teichoic acid export membrane protein